MAIGKAHVMLQNVLASQVLVFDSSLDNDPVEQKRGE